MLLLPISFIKDAPRSVKRICKAEFKKALNCKINLSDAKMILFYILIPFHGEEVFFIIIALLAGRDQIALGAFTSTGQGHNMIHGQLFNRSITSAVMA